MLSNCKSPDSIRNSYIAYRMKISTEIQGDHLVVRNWKMKIKLHASNTQWYRINIPILKMKEWEDIKELLNQK